MGRPFASSNQRRRRDAPTSTHEHHQPVRPHLYFCVFLSTLRVSFGHFLRVRVPFFIWKTTIELDTKLMSFTGYSKRIRPEFVWLRGSRNTTRRHANVSFFAASPIGATKQKKSLARVVGRCSPFVPVVWLLNSSEEEKKTLPLVCLQSRQRPSRERQMDESASRFTMRFFFLNPSGSR